MKFGSVTLSQAQGGILAHSLTLPNGERLRKGLEIDATVLEALKLAGMTDITIAMPQEGDVGENVAATLIAKQFENHNIRIEKASTGRVNLFASCNGVFRVTGAVINSFNAVDPAITLATLPDFASVNEGRLIATIKIIPYTVSSTSLEEVLSLETENAISIAPYRKMRVGLVATQLPSLKASVMDKTRRLLDQRLALCESEIISELRVPHATADIADAISQIRNDCDLMVIFGASAICDIADCIPQAIRECGGEIVRFGMPVDPGNLMLMAKLGGMPVIGAPGCARSKAENGFDWILQRLIAGIEVTSEDIAGMGVGGLLMETGARPHPRERKTVKSGVVAGLIMAAGQSRRMGEQNKMTVKVKGKPMVRHVMEAATASRLDRVTLVTGHKPHETREALNGLVFDTVHNPDYDQGLSTSLSSGIISLGATVSHALVLLGDMPFVNRQMIDLMLEKSQEAPDAIIVATHEGKRGNPVLWPRTYFANIASIEGDVGAKHILEANKEKVVEVELGEAASIDLDTPAAVKSHT